MNETFNMVVSSIMGMSVLIGMMIAMLLYMVNKKAKKVFKILAVLTVISFTISIILRNYTVNIFLGIALALLVVEIVLFAVDLFILSEITPKGENNHVRHNEKVDTEEVSKL